MTYVIDPSRFAVTGGGGGVPVIESSSSATHNGSGSVSVSVPTGTTEGDLEIFIASAANNSSPIENLVPSGATTVYNSGGLSGVPHLAVLWRVAPASNSAWAWWFSSGGNKAGIRYRISGFNASPINTYGTGVSAGASPTKSGITTTVDNCLCIGACSFWGTDWEVGSTASSGWTTNLEIQSLPGINSAPTCNTATHEATSSGSVPVVTWSFTGGDDWRTIVFAIAP